MIDGKKYNGNLVDIWSSGIILFAMLCGYLPFEGQTNDILFKNIVICKVEYPKYLSNIAVDLLKKILVKNPENRINLQEIKMHPFYLKGKEIFKKMHPDIYEDFKKNSKLKYTKYINQTEGNEKEKYEKRRMNIRSMNLDDIPLDNPDYKEEENIDESNKKENLMKMNLHIIIFN